MSTSNFYLSLQGYSKCAWVCLATFSRLLTLFQGDVFQLTSPWDLQTSPDILTFCSPHYFQRCNHSDRRDRKVCVSPVCWCTPTCGCTCMSFPLYKAALESQEVRWSFLPWPRRSWAGHTPYTDPLHQISATHWCHWWDLLPSSCMLVWDTLWMYTAHKGEQQRVLLVFGCGFPGVPRLYLDISASMRKLWDQVRNLITGVNFILQILRRQLWLSTASFSIAFGTADKIRNQEKDKIHSSMTPRPASQRLKAGKRLLIYNINTARKDLRSDPIRAIDIWNQWKWIQALIKNTRAFLTETHFFYVMYNAEICSWGEIGDGIFYNIS